MRRPARAALSVILSAAALAGCKASGTVSMGTPPPEKSAPPGQSKHECKCSGCQCNHCKGKAPVCTCGQGEKKGHKKQ